MQKQARFQWKPFIRSVCAIAVPVALQNLLTTTGTVIDTMMIAPLGENAVGAIGLCAMYSSLMMTGYWGFVGSGTLFFSQYWGAKDDDGIDRSYGMTLTFMLATALVFALAALFAPQIGMGILTDKPGLQEIGMQYLRIASVGYILQVLSVAMSTLLRSTEQVRIPLIASILSVVTNITLNWALIHGRLGLPAMGVRGAALATTIAAGVNAGAIFLMARIKKYPYLFHFRRHFRWTKAHLRQYFRRCWPILLNEVMYGIGGGFFSIVLGRQSESAIAALAVFRTLESLVIGFSSGFSSASSVLVGKCVGAGELDTAYQRAKRLAPLCSGCILTVCAIVLSVHKPLLSSMSLSGESLEIGRQLLIVYTFAAVLRTATWSLNDAYRASGDAVTGTVLEISFMYLMLMPLVYLTGMVLHSPFPVIFACTYIDEPFRFVLMRIRLHTGKWIRPVTPEGMAALPEFMENRRRKKR